MKKPGQYSNAETVKAWADIVINIWGVNLDERELIVTEALFNSLKHDLDLHAGNSVEKIEFSFNFYGIHVDTGIEGVKRRQWYSKYFYGQVMRLKEILAEKYGKNAASQIAFAMQPLKSI